MPALQPPIQLLWFEKYRPTKLAELALDSQQRSLLQAYIDAQEIPHLLFSGPPGTGKTSLARILIAAIDCDVLTRNASKDRGIDTIRNDIGVFAKVLGFKKWKVVFLDEGDGLTPEAQNSLRNMMEDYSDQTRFIFTANAKNRIIDPIQSRCTQVDFVGVPLRERILVLQRILAAEQVTQVDLRVVLWYAERYADLRKMITAAEQSVVSNNGVLAASTTVIFLGVDLLELVASGQWGELVKAAASPGFDHRQSLISMFWSVDDVKKIKSPVGTKSRIAHAIHESQWTPDPVVHFLGTCAELMEL